MTSNSMWRADALCAQTDPDLMFPDTNTANRAKRVCNFCEVQAECLADALSEQVQYGIRAGLSAVVRQKMRAEMNQQNGSDQQVSSRIAESRKRPASAQTDRAHGSLATVESRE